tara:strand:- start:591 stop:782 length:192 start_codon:yes stop_codon:yes gene_type:complete
MSASIDGNPKNRFLKIMENRKKEDKRKFEKMGRLSMQVDAQKEKLEIQQKVKLNIQRKFDMAS